MVHISEVLCYKLEGFMFLTTFFCMLAIICSVHLSSCSVSNGKLALKLTILYFFSSILLKFWPFLQLSELLQPIYASQSTFLVLLCIHNNFLSRFVDLQCSKRKTGLKNLRYYFFYLNFAQILSLFADFRAPMDTFILKVKIHSFL